MNDTLLNAYSGIKTHQFGIDSLSNNIANINTVGYRENIPEFKSLFSAHLDTLGSTNVTADDRNFGVTKGSNAILDKDGEYMPSDSEFNMAYQGSGWFIVGPNKNGSLEINKDGYKQAQENFFTRDGNFLRDADGYIVNAHGYYVYGVDLHKIKNGVLVAGNPDEEAKILKSGKLSTLYLPRDVQYQPVLTTKVDMSINLNAKNHVRPAEEYFLNKDGEIINERFLNQDANALANDDNEPLDLAMHRNLEIMMVKGDMAQDLTFKYGTGGPEKNEFHTLGDLKNLLKTKANLDLTIAKSKPDQLKSPLMLQIKNPTDPEATLFIGGPMADKLGWTASGMILKKGETRDSVGIRIPFYSTTAEIYDKGGDKYLLKSDFFMTNSKDPMATPPTTEKWDVESSILEMRSKLPITPQSVRQTITFDKDGKMQAKPITLNFKGSPLTYNLAKSEDYQSSDVPYEDSKIYQISQDGKPKGLLQNMRIDDNGVIHLAFSNGAIETMGRVGIAAFTNDQGLRKVGSNLFDITNVTRNGRASPLSGNPILGWDRDDGKLKFGKVMHKYLETSNVNAGRSLTNLILMQRGYSMNAKAFTTGDDLVKEAINLKK
ncbi:flagellar hook-basal body complex protein [Helicobacter heilmannii]|uniref:Flagellar hook protein FlgE n=1 Tax=Helicobacter heilmannii TaxID=35817 RepID=A0A0K2Y766_HELHE|nr:flagellar hook-basal body complex protein [Helicobacter heilmannii]CCM11833.1 Flagellar hook protein FlgE [Helicobacter heilmannii ASB1.4]CRI33972.1 Flagellar hook protein FlgE [Helicobacter heilmannii]